MIFGANVDFEKIIGIKGASMRISGAYNTGKDLSGKIGNFFTISESAVTGGWMFYELYYSQKSCAIMINYCCKGVTKCYTIIEGWC